MRITLPFPAEVRLEGPTRSGGPPAQGESGTCVIRPPAGVIDAVKCAVRRSEVPAPILAPAKGASVAGFQSGTILALLVYCYLLDVYGSGDIEEALRGDAGVRALCGQEYPDASVLRRFRRRNRDSIHAALAGALQLVGACPAHDDADLEAGRRLAKAMFIDAMEGDG